MSAAFPYFNLRRFRNGLLVAAFVVPTTGSAAGAGIMHVGPFSESRAHGELPEGWEPLVFKKIKRHTRYQLVDDNGVVVVQADSQASSSGLVRKLHVDPKKYPVLRWRWKIDNILKKGDVHTKAGDDYPARLYITFAYDPEKAGFFERIQYQTARILYGEYPPRGAINYIWANRAAVGLEVPNSYTERVRMVVVESGSDRVHQWIVEQRNVLRDYIQIYGEDPPVISGVAIMTDSDNTGESARAYYGDIEFLSADDH